MAVQDLILIQLSHLRSDQEKGAKEEKEKERERRKGHVKLVEPRAEAQGRGDPLYCATVLPPMHHNDNGLWG